MFPCLSPGTLATNFLDGEDLERVIGALPPHLKGITRFASITGWRKQEILGLQWGNVDAVVKVIRLECSEPGACRSLTLRRHEDHRTQDRGRLSPLRHRRST